MSITLTTAAIEQFDTDVHLDYQERGFKLMGMTRERSGVVGEDVRFPIMGEGIAKQRNAPQSDVVPMNVAHSNVQCFLSDWDASEYSDIFNQAEINFSERQELVQLISMGLGRRCDQLIIDALNGSGATVESSGTVLTVAKLRAAAKLLNAANVPMEDRCFVLHANNLDQLLAETETTSSDFNTVKALVQGELNTFLGFKFIMFGDMTEGGVPITGGTRNCFAFHKRAVGFATGIPKTTEINYIPQKKSWLTSGHLKAGAVAIDADGIVIVEADEP